MNKIRKILFGLHFFVGIGAMAGGFGCLMDFYNPLGAPVSLLENSPFTSYFFPGLFLFAVLGIGNVICSLLLWRYSIVGPLSSLTFGFILMAWIVIQCIILGSVEALHVIFFGFGALQFGLALWHLLATGDIKYLLGELIN